MTSTNKNNNDKKINTVDYFFWLGEGGELQPLSEEEFFEEINEEMERERKWREVEVNDGKVEPVGQPTNRRGEEFTNDDPNLIGTGAIKYDGGKAASFRGLVNYFPKALYAVSEISTFGARKYAWNGWEGVEDGVARYSDAMVRHLLAEGQGEDFDPDSGLLHAAHTAWGSLARLELMLREREGHGG